MTTGSLMRVESIAECSLWNSKHKHTHIYDYDKFHVLLSMKVL